MQTLEIVGCKICLSSENEKKKNIHAKQHFARKAISVWSSLTSLSQLTKLLLMDWVVIEFFTDPSLFIRRRITPQLQESKPLWAVFIPDRCTDCGCFLQSNMTSYCHYLIPLSVIMFWLTEKGGYVSLLSVKLCCIHTFLCPFSYTDSRFKKLFMYSSLYAPSFPAFMHVLNSLVAVRKQKIYSRFKGFSLYYHQT